MSNDVTELQSRVFRRIGWVLPALGFILPLTSMAADTRTARKVRFREPRQSAYILVEPGIASAGTNAPSAAGASRQWTQARLETSTNLVELSSRLVVQLAPGIDLNAMLTNRGL